MHSAARSPEQSEAIPRLAPDWDSADRALSSAEGFLLSRIDGRTPWTQLRQIGGIPPEEVDRCLMRWIAEGVILTTEGTVLRSEIVDPQDRHTEVSADDGRIDPGLDLSPELQRHILDFEAGLDRPYFEVLKVSRGADAAEIKRAYFALSKVYHPDRYFRRNLGEYAGRLDRIFRKLVEAYELLSDPTTRTEIERSIPPEASPEPEPAEPEHIAGSEPGTPRARGAARRKRKPRRSLPPRVLTKRETLERLRRHFKIPETLVAERRQKARQFFEVARVAAARERWKEAAPSLRLAIAFDPWTDEYRAHFIEYQVRYHEQRAEEILAQDAEQWDSGAQAQALRLLEEVLNHRPGDARVNARAAGLALGLDDLARAREYAEAACERCPESAQYQLTLGRVLRRSGLRERAIEALRNAARLDPDDQEIQRELRDSRRSGRRKEQGGGKSWGA